jgi:bis(5'-nucleosyl)-tetraphosphatase (symmetrical)
LIASYRIRNRYLQTEASPEKSARKVDFTTFMKSYNTFYITKHASSDHLRKLSQEMPRVPTITNARALPLLTSAIFLGTCCGFVFLKSHRVSTAKGVEGRASNYEHVHSTILANSAYRDVRSMLQSYHSEKSRTYSTGADNYYQKFKELPKPLIIHENLSRLVSEETRAGADDERTNKILIIGDVHGCLDELKSLVTKASNDHNEGKQFAATILVGDLVNKGPYSLQVVKFVKEQPYWYSIRGNHDNAALEAALGDSDRLSREQYSWVGELSDEDVELMANLPYTIRIPKDDFLPTLSEDVLIVHAGLLPNVRLDEQNIKTMVTVRDLALISGNDANGDPLSNAQYEYYNPSDRDKNPISWAKAWAGPELLVFGHDAKRQIQLETYAIGLDSGCVYGGKLTGIVLPEKELVSVDAAKVYCPIKDKNE